RKWLSTDCEKLSSDILAPLPSAGAGGGNTLSTRKCFPSPNPSRREGGFVALFHRLLLKRLLIQADYPECSHQKNSCPRRAPLPPPRGGSLPRGIPRPPYNPSNTSQDVCALRAGPFQCRSGPTCARNALE